MAKTAISFFSKFIQKRQHFSTFSTTTNDFEEENVNHVVYRFSERKEVFPERITVAWLHLIGQFHEGVSTSPKYNILEWIGSYINGLTEYDRQRQRKSSFADLLGFE